jgi:hypothetical protein
MDHVVIRRVEYVSGTRDRPEIGIFTQAHQTRHPVPWGQITVGDTVWMKWSRGPIVARATVQGFRQIQACSPDRLRQIVTGCKLYDLKDYWVSLPPAFSAVVIWLDDERWLDSPVFSQRQEPWRKLGAIEDLRTSRSMADHPSGRAIKKRQQKGSAYPYAWLRPQVPSSAARWIHLPVLRRKASGRKTSR